MALYIFVIVIVAVAGAVVVGDKEFVGVVGIESVAGVRRRALCTPYGCRLSLCARFPSPRCCPWS